MLEERESENPPNVAEMDEVNTVEIGEMSTSPARSSTCLQGAPMRAESIAARLADEDRNLTMAEKDCVFTSSYDDLEDLVVFVTEKLQCLSEGSLETLIGDGSKTVE